MSGSIMLSTRSKKPMVFIACTACTAVIAASCGQSDSRDLRERMDDAPIPQVVVENETAADFSPGCEAHGLEAGVRELSFEIDGRIRKFLISVPNASAEPVKAYPLLIAMHGFGGSGVSMRSAIGGGSSFEERYVVLYPDGAREDGGPRGWNSGHPQCCGIALEKNIDDVGFLRAMVKFVSQSTCIDRNRIYATGFSNGGDMAQRLACDSGELFAAVSSVAGRFDYHTGACPGGRPVPTALYRGERDLTVPFDKGVLALAALKTIPALEGFAQIARNHRCIGKPDVTLSRRDTRCLRFDQCMDEYELTLCASAKSGHCWPGPGGCGPVGDDEAVFSASDHMSGFFTKHAVSTQ